jgi:hypothetical protein
LRARTSRPAVAVGTRAMEARLEIEPRLARLAAAKASPEALTTMRLILRRLGASEDHETMERWDGAFHRLIAETAGTLRARRSNRAHCGGAPHPAKREREKCVHKILKRVGEFSPRSARRSDTIAERVASRIAPAPWNGWREACCLQDRRPPFPNRGWTREAPFEPTSRVRKVGRQCALGRRRV